MAAGETLILEARDFKDPQHWRWVLKDDQGKQIDDYEVRLDAADANYQAFLNLQNELDLRSSPDNWIDEQREFLGKIGTWISQNIFSRIGQHIIDRTPVTVKVIIPPEATGIMYLPLELAHFDGGPLSLMM